MTEEQSLRPFIQCSPGMGMLLMLVMFVILWLNYFSGPTDLILNSLDLLNKSEFLTLLW